VRHVLNLRVADEAVQALLSEPQLLRLYYRDASILCNADNATVLMGLLRSLKVLPFAFTTDDAALNTAPAWLLAMITAAAVGDSGGGAAASPMPVPRSVPYSPAGSGSSTSTSVTPSRGRRGGMFSALFNALERGLNGVIETMDAFASKVATSDTPLGDAFAALEGRRRAAPLYGTPLRHLVLDDRRCSVCHMDPRLGVPGQVSPSPLPHCPSPPCHSTLIVRALLVTLPSLYCTPL